MKRREHFVLTDSARMALVEYADECRRSSALLAEDGHREEAKDYKSMAGALQFIADNAPAHIREGVAFAWESVRRNG
jgi:hypothetical protein